MAKLFEESKINGMTMRNRIVRSATWEGMCDQNGRPTEKLIDYYLNLANGGVGLIVTGYTFVSSEGKQLPGKMGIHTDDFADEYIKMTSVIHEAGGKIAIQLVHAGGQTDTINAGRQPLAPSAVKVEQYPEIPAELTKNEISEIVADFVEGARRAKTCEWKRNGVRLAYMQIEMLIFIQNGKATTYRISRGILSYNCPWQPAASHFL